MSDEYIELPPLPKASKMYDIPGYDEEELKDYARTAILADRADKLGKLATALAKKDKEIEALREAMGLARAVLAQSIAAGHNVPGPAPEDIEKAFWALDAAITASDAKPRANEKKGQ